MRITRWLMQQFLDLAQAGALLPLNEREERELAAHAAQMAAQPHAYHALGDSAPAPAVAKARRPQPPTPDAPGGIAVAAPISLRPR